MVSFHLILFIHPFSLWSPPPPPPRVRYSRVVAMEIMTSLFQKRMLYLSGASVLATSISLGPRRFLQPSTASSFARHSAMTGPLQNTNKGLKFKVRMTRICLLSP